MIQTNGPAGAMFRRLVLRPADFVVELPTPREALKPAGRSVRKKMPESKKRSLKSVALAVDH